MESETPDPGEELKEGEVAASDTLADGDVREEEDLPGEASPGEEQ